MKLGFSGLLFAAVAPFAGVAGVALAQTASIPGVVEVFSDKAEYDGNRSVFSGNVTLAAGQMTLAANKLEVETGDDGNLYRATGSPVRIVCGRCFGEGAVASAESVEYDDAKGVARAVGQARVCAGRECETGKLSAGELEWRRGEDAFVARGGAETFARLAWRPPEGEAVEVSAREIRYDFGERSALLSGDAEATRGDSLLRGDTILFNRDTGAMRAEATPEGERVRAVFGVGKTEEGEGVEGGEGGEGAEGER